MKYAVLVKHFARDMSDVRVEIVDVPEMGGAHAAEALVREKLLGPFEVIAVTDRISDRTLSPTTLAADEAFERIEAMHEYWNRDYNEQAMRDALDFIMAECAALLAKAQPARKGE